MTLIELLIASILIGIVMIGVLAFNLSIKRIQESTDKDTLIMMRTQASLTRMARDASMAIGDTTDRGIIILPEGALTSVSFRHDRNNTPSDYTDDTWVIYYTSGTTLYTCEQPVASFPGTPWIPNQTSGQPCSTGQATIVTTQLVGGSARFETSPGSYVQLSHTLRAIPANTAHPINNPEYTATINVRPLAHTQ